MPNPKLSRRFILAALATIGSAITPVYDAKAGPGPLRIGVLFPVSGSMAGLGQETYDGALIARDLINAAGGVNGRLVEFVFADAPDPEHARLAAEDLITREKVSVILGCYGSAQTLAVAEVTEKHKTVLWVDTAWTSALFATPLHYVFRTSVFATPVTQAAISYSKRYLLPALQDKSRPTKIVLVHEDGPYGSSLGHELQTAADAAGIQISQSFSYNRLAPELTQVAKSIQAAAPDLLLAVSFPDDAKRLVDGLVAQQYWPKAIMTTSTGWGLYTLPGNIGEKVEGIFVANAPAVINPAALNKQGQELASSLSAAFESRRGRKPSAFASMGFVAAYSLLRHVLPTARDPDNADDVRAAALKVDVPAGTYPNGWGLQMDPSGQNIRAPATVDQWQRGELVTVDPSQMATAKPNLPKM